MGGIFPLVQSLDHVGPMAKNVGDTHLIWAAISGQQMQSGGNAPRRVGFDPGWLAEADDDIGNAVLGAFDQMEVIRHRGERN